MRDLEFIDSFVPAGGKQAYSAVVLGAGLTWLDVYVAASVDRNLVGSCLSFNTSIKFYLTSTLNCSMCKAVVALALALLDGTLVAAMAVGPRSSAPAPPTCWRQRSSPQMVGSLLLQNSRTKVTTSGKTLI